MKWEKLFEEFNTASDNFEEDNFADKNSVFGWKKFVPDELQEDWNLLTDRERKLIFIMAVNHAIHVDWDD